MRRRAPLPPKLTGMVITRGDRGLGAAGPTAQSVPVDVCLIGQTPSVFLQQAAYLTEGCYVAVGDVTTLLQVLLVLAAAACAHGGPRSDSPAACESAWAKHAQSVFSVDRYLRKLVRLPVNEEIDFRASCICHRNVVDMGYVCSVCLSSTTKGKHRNCGGRRRPHGWVAAAACG